MTKKIGQRILKMTVLFAEDAYIACFSYHEEASRHRYAEAQKHSPLWNIPTNRDTIHSINSKSSFLQVNDYHYADPLYHLAQLHYELGRSLSCQL